jgi:hypothetical protein
MRERLVARLIFQRDSQRSDLLDPASTNTALIAALYALTEGGHHLEITAVRTDHHFDGEGDGYHASGCAVDLWPLVDGTQGNYVSPETLAFRSFLQAVADVPYRMQVGLGGSAWTQANVEATGLDLASASVFQDDGEDHVHLGVHAD